MEQDMNLDLLTLQDIEDCANAVLLSVNPKKTEGIRNRGRKLSEELLCRYCFYKFARSIRLTERKRYRGIPGECWKPYKFPMQQIVWHLDIYGNNHSNVLHGIRAMDNMLEQRHQMAMDRWEAMNEEIKKILIKKDKDGKAAKRILLGRI